VGEVCRYLLNQPASEVDKAHSIRKCIGNGVRANIHKEFSDRFGIKCIEIYGATEGNCVVNYILFNINNQPFYLFFFILKLGEFIFIFKLRYSICETIFYINS
jgi:hypothetical protein